MCFVLCFTWVCLTMSFWLHNDLFPAVISTIYNVDKIIVTRLIATIAEYSAEYHIFGWIHNDAIEKTGMLSYNKQYRI